ncbi:MAG: PAS domain S-box protein, partial [Candidatus Aureabacteria bacterium]|nr:PAS domain S-box protein [Candidatus Auribacterota bacterium]
MKYHDRVFFTFINQTKWACLSVAVCLLTICCHLSYAEKTTSFKHVLILHSYHDSYPWTKEEMKGIQSVLGKEPDGIEMHVMYMDTKKIYNDNYLKLFYGMLAYKMKMVRYDAILLTDNDAFDFIRKHRQGVFKDIPVFFCGISNFDDSLLQGDSKMTGVVENSDYRSTIEIALQLRPMAEQVVVISDSTLTGQLHENQTRLLVPLFQGRAQFEFISLAKFSMDELLERLNQLKDDSVVFLLGHFIDKTGRIFSQAEAMGLIVSASRVPVFVLTDTRVNSGVVGGKVVCGFYQGKKAAEMLLQYATGKSIERIPVIKESPNRYMFDYKALKRFEIPFSALPQDSLILNKPVSYYKINKHRVNTALMIGGVFLVLFSFLGLNISKRKRMEKTLLEYEKQFMKVFNASPNAMGISCIKEGRFLEINENFSSVMGFQREEVLGKTALELQLWVDLEERQSFVESMMKYGYYKNREVLMRHKSGQILFILFSGAIIEFNEQKCILSVAQDITERKKIEEELL